MDYEPETYGPLRDPEAARGKTMVPGILVIVSAVVNALFTLYLFGNGVYVATRTPEQLKEQTEAMRKMFPAMAEQDPGQLKTISLAENFGGGIIVGLATLVMIFGGIQMIRLQTYGLAVFAAILALIPCVSCAGCFGLGQVAGIWALVVLMKPDVKSTFR